MPSYDDMHMADELPSTFNPTGVREWARDDSGRSAARSWRSC